jgi:hypothetical protein
LAKIAGAVYYCTPDMKFYFEEWKIKDTGLEFVDTDILTTPKYTRSLIPLKNVIYVLGGKYHSVDREVSD